MAKASRLKVYRTAIGFHDAYVAASSQKAALAAWGSDKDLFARGAAELVTDPALTAEPLARPGTVVRRLRGSVADNIAALPADRSARRSKARSRAAMPDGQTPRSPRPDRAPLEAAEQAVADARDRHEQALAALAEREAALARERRALAAAQRSELAGLTRKRDAAADAYQAAMRRWQG